MRIQYCSDLHLEFRTNKHIPTLLKNLKECRGRTRTGG
jgi:hypothetical protein